MGVVQGRGTGLHAHAHSKRFKGLLAVGTASAALLSSLGLLLHGAAAASATESGGPAPLSIATLGDQPAQPTGGATRVVVTRKAGVPAASSVSEAPTSATSATPARVQV